MIVNYNANLQDFNELTISFFSSALEGNIIHQKFLIIKEKICFLEESYFNLMVTMRKMRMEIPLHFTIDFIKEQIYIVLYKNSLLNASVTVKIFKDAKDCSYVIFINEIEANTLVQNTNFTIDVYKDILLCPNFYNSQPIIHIENIIAKKYAKENDLDDIIFLTNNKKIARTILGNIYFITENKIISILPADGIYKQAIDAEFHRFLKLNTNFEFFMQSLSPFETQNMDEIFVLEEGKGVHLVSQIRQKHFASCKSQLIVKDFFEFIQAN